jgi:hypothetical protein
MRKNQRFNKADMYAHIAKWYESGISQHLYCQQEKIATSTFCYWLKKYKRDQVSLTPRQQGDVKSFIPVEVARPLEVHSWQFEICYPNGVQIRCAEGTDTNMLKAMIGMSHV